MTVRTRFAPSPTGYLHIGGVRTALFNWLFARKHGGQFILRIDDTDQQRNVAEALQPIIDGFRWLGLDWDEGPEVGGPHGPYSQSQKLPRYQEAVRQLLDKGLAYWDYATPEETKAEMEAAEKERRPKIYSRRWTAETDADRKRFEAEGRKGSVKAKMPRDGVCRFTDHVRGIVEVPWAGEQDTVIQRSDGSVTYNLANVVDDFDMKISHVIRAEEHLANTPRQIFMLEGLGYPRPEYAHLPFVAEPPIKGGGKNKLSKRKIASYLTNAEFKKVYDHGKAVADRLGLRGTPETFNPVLTDFYQTVGYLPAAVLNYLVLLGWSLDGSTEEFAVAQMKELFSLERVTKGAASFDAKKLFAFQERAMVALPTAEKVAMVTPYLVRAGFTPYPAMVTAIVEAAGPRLKVAGDILDYTEFFAADDQLVYDPKAVAENVTGEPAAGWVVGLREVLATTEPFDVPTLKAAVEAFAAARGAKLKPVSQTLRVLVTGKEVGFGTFDTLALLGRERCLARIDGIMGEKGDHS
ncbi:MAG: glutamate--tRNA ligase [Gemmataceae bacterium]|nr:glutamate--tRNA ligase [Gemmataceae bacterium]